MSAPQRAPQERSLVLYVAGTSRRALCAMGELRRFVEEHRDENWRLDVIDVLQPERRDAAREVLMTPTVVARIGATEHRVVGHFEDLASCLRQRAESGQA